MKCFDPVLCYALNNKKIFRHWSVAKLSPVFRAYKPTFVFNCDKCLYCRKRRSLELAARCVLHGSLYLHNMFLTLTYDEKQEGYHNELDYTDIQKFKKRLRSYVSRDCNQRIDIFNVHEYGKNKKKHWHLLVFNYSFADKKIHTIRNGLPLYTSERLSLLWPAGFSTIGDLSEASAMYQAQYMEKDFRNGNITNSFKSASRHSGLGKPYFLKHYSQILRLGYIPFSGRKLPIPRYFQKIAHKHWCHFNETSAFFDIPKQRKALYRPFKIGEENLQISQLYSEYKNMKQERILELEKEFEETILSYLGTKTVPSFVQSGLNAEYDLKNKLTHERF